MSLENAKKELEKLRQEALKLGKKTEIATEDIDSLKEMVAKIEAEALDGRVSALEDFFKSVGSSMVSAQQDLDQRSLAYQAEGAPYPTHFRIPKAEARFQFSLSSASQTGFNVILFSSRERQERSQHQEVSFEIASVPATVERMGIPPAPLQATPAIRALIEERLREIDGQTKTASRVAQDFDRALCIQALTLSPSDPGKGKHVWLVLYLDEDWKPSVFKLDAEGSARMNPGPALEIKATQTQRALFLGLFRAMVEEQVLWLKALKARNA